MEKKCPLCKSDLKEYTEYKFTEVTWSDGLGSPGTMCHRTNWIVCTKCSFRVLPEDYKQAQFNWREQLPRKQQIQARILLPAPQEKQ